VGGTGAPYGHGQGLLQGGGGLLEQGVGLAGVVAATLDDGRQAAGDFQGQGGDILICRAPGGDAGRLGQRSSPATLRAPPTLAPAHHAYARFIHPLPNAA
jgi:hypothetical protein